MVEAAQDRPTRPARDPHRRGWTRSFLIALSIHAGIAFWLVSHIVPEPPSDVLPRIAPLLRASIVEETGTPIELSAKVESSEVSDTLQDLEPSIGEIRAGIDRAVSEAVTAAASSDAYRRLTEQARILEQVSNPHEVGRMAEQISAAMGVKAWPSVATSRPARSAPFDFDKAMLIDVTREESGGVVTIREIMGTRDGARAVIESMRLSTPHGVRFEQRLIEPDAVDSDEPLLLPMDAEDFAAAEARQRPYELIRQYPLVQQLHQTAVLPLLEKMVEESPTDTPNPGAPPP